MSDDFEGALWQETPLIYSNQLSENLKADVYLKLENIHPSHSFKYRGISYYIQSALAQHGPSVHVVIASGGNAGLAAACAAHCLNLKCTVFIPNGVEVSTLRLLKDEKAEVVVAGQQYSEALKAARDLVDREPVAVMVPAYDDPIVWKGHSSMVHEIKKQLKQKPDALFCSVGGGGLLGGLIVGCKDNGWDDVPLISLETTGSDCFHHSISLNPTRFNHSTQSTLPRPLPNLVTRKHNPEHNVHLAHFAGFWSKASGSLGASEPAAGVVKMALERGGGIRTASVSDELSMGALVRFADDHKFLVELACSTTLVPAYNPALFDKLLARRDQDSKTQGQAQVNQIPDPIPLNDQDDTKERQRQRPVVVFIVCGGFKIDITTVQEYRKVLGEVPEGYAWSVECGDGEVVSWAK